MKQRSTLRITYEMLQQLLGIDFPIISITANSVDETLVIVLQSNQNCQEGSTPVEDYELKTDIMLRYNEKEKYRPIIEYIMKQEL